MYDTFWLNTYAVSHTSTGLSSSFLKRRWNQRPNERSVSAVLFGFRDVWTSETGVMLGKLCHKPPIFWVYTSHLYRFMVFLGMVDPSALPCFTNVRTYSKPQKDGNVNSYFQIVAILNSYFFGWGLLWYSCSARMVVSLQLLRIKTSTLASCLKGPRSRWLYYTLSIIIGKQLTEWCIYIYIHTMVWGLSMSEYQNYRVFLLEDHTLNGSSALAFEGITYC